MTIMSSDSLKISKEKLTLYKEYRLIERNETEISGSWKGTHLLFFFLAFVFGSFCTFCFHVLMYLFDEKCVLFPKLLLLKELRHTVLYEYMPNAGLIETLPVDFVTTHWMDKSTCYLPTYVPLVSGIFGLVWTTMFLMFSSGSRTLGLQRSWRLLPPVFIFSVAMGSLCIYTSAVTTSGLMDLCAKLSEVTGSTTCSYTINVVTLAFERRIRGVFQAIQLTIISAWLHTCCWVLAALVALLRVILVIDFRLVCVSADLCGNIEKMLERHEKHIRTVSPEQGTKDTYTNTRLHAHSLDSIKVRFTNKEFERDSDQTPDDGSTQQEQGSTPSLVPEENKKIVTMMYYSHVPKEHLFIVDILLDVLNNVSYSSHHHMTIKSSVIEETKAFPPNVDKEPSQEVESTIKLAVETKDSVESRNSDIKELYSRSKVMNIPSSLSTTDTEKDLKQKSEADLLVSSPKHNIKDDSETSQKKQIKLLFKFNNEETTASAETLKPLTEITVQKIVDAATFANQVVNKLLNETFQKLTAASETSSPGRPVRPTRVSRSEDQELGDVFPETTDEEDHLSVSTVDAGMQTRPKEKQD